MPAAKKSTIALDTNILVYAFDTSEPKKRKASKQLFEDVLSGKRKAVVTNQVLAEFAYVITKKVGKPLRKEQAASIISTILTNPNWTVVDYKGETVVRALGSERPFWDALLAQTLKEHGIPELLTENTRDFAGSGITAKHPL